jgi:hemerythrin
MAKTGAPRGRVEMVLEELGSCTVKHFANEERHMQAMKFPGFGTHQQIHKSLLDKFTAHVTAFKASKDNAPPQEFFTFLKMWLQAHIAGVDRKYADHGK